jgi:hypothetical protein
MGKQTTLKLVHTASSLSGQALAANRGQSVDLLRRILVPHVVDFGVDL